jgi:hypothetical protein
MIIISFFHLISFVNYHNTQYNSKLHIFYEVFFAPVNKNKGEYAFVYKPDFIYFVNSL